MTQRDQSMKNTNMQPHEGAVVTNADPNPHFEKVDIEKEKQQNLPEIIRTETEPAKQEK